MAASECGWVEVLQEFKGSFLNKRNGKCPSAHPTPLMNLTGCLALGSLKCLSGKGLIDLCLLLSPSYFQASDQPFCFLRPGTQFNLDIRKLRTI